MFRNRVGPTGGANSRMTDSLLFAVLASSVELVEKVVPADLLTLFVENFCLYVCVVSASAIAATARARAPTRAPMKSLRKLLSSSNRGNGPCATDALGQGRSH